jgi:hypothetical protein
MLRSKNSGCKLVTLIKGPVRAGFLGALIIGALTSAVLNDGHAADLQKPQAVVERASFDWGSVSQGTSVQHGFALKNAGNAELVIQRIVPSCGCTAVSTSSDRIPVGGQTTIRVEVDTAGFSGAKERTVRLFTNDPDSPFTTLTLKGVIEPDVLIEPPRIIFPEFIRDVTKEPLRAEFSVRVRPGAVVKVGNITNYSKFVSLREIGRADKERRVEVLLDPNIPSGEFRDRIVVALDGGTTNAVNIPVLASIRGKVQLKPSTLSFGVIEGRTTISKRVRLENAGLEPLNILGIKGSTAAVKAQYKVVKPGKIFDIQVDVDPTQVVKDLRAAVTIETDSASDRTLNLDVYGILPP